MQTYKRTDRQTASRTWRCSFLFPCWGETPAELGPLLGPLSVSWLVDESPQGVCEFINVRKPTVSTKNPKWTTLGMKQDLRGENMVTSCLSYDMAPWRSNRLISEFRLFGVNELNICGSVHRAFVVKIIPTRCNNCGLFIANVFILHISGDNPTHHQEYMCCMWPHVSRHT